MNKPRKGSLLGLRDKVANPAVPIVEKPSTPRKVPAGAMVASGAAEFIPSGEQAEGRRLTAVLPPSRAGRKAMTGYFPPELSEAMRVTAIRNRMTLQDAMGEAMNDWLRKMGESPVGL